MVPSLIHKIREQWKNLRQQIPPPYRLLCEPRLGGVKFTFIGSLFLPSDPLRPIGPFSLMGRWWAGWRIGRSWRRPFTSCRKKRKSSYGPGIELARALEFEQVTGRNIKCEERARWPGVWRGNGLHPAGIPYYGRWNPGGGLKQEIEAQQVLDAVREQYLPTEEDTVLEEMTMAGR